MTPPRLTRTALRRELRRLGRQFADEVFETLERHGVLDALAQRHGAQDASAGGTAGARVRRSDAALEQITKEIVRALRTSREPVAISTIAARMGSTPRHIAHPLALLVARGEVVKTGERRGTRYQLERRRRGPGKVASKTRRRGGRR